MPTKEELQTGFRIGDWEVLPDSGVLRSGEREEHPEPMVLQVLLALARRDGGLVTRDDLVDEVWGGRPTSDEPINQKLSQLRRHLGDHKQGEDHSYRYIQTLTKRGYRLNEKVQLLRPATVNGEEVVRTDRARNQGRLWIVVAAIAATILIAMLVRSGFMDRPVDQSVGSIAVLPFENLGDDSDQYLVAGFKEELVHTLRNIPDLAIKHGRIAYPDLEVSEIAELLDVDAVLFGAVQRDGDDLKISYSIADGRTGNNISSNLFETKQSGLFAVHKRLAVMVRDDLVGGSARELISRSQPASFEAYDRYLQGMHLFDRRPLGSNLEEAIELFKQTIEIDPSFGPAYLQLAAGYALLPGYRQAPMEEALRLAMDTVNQGIAADESIREASNEVFAYVYHRQRQWGKAEAAYLQAINGQVVDSNAFNWYARMLMGVGRLDEALHYALEAQKIDPSSAIINSLLALVYTVTGDVEQAYEFHERSERLGVSGQYHLLGSALNLIRQGRIERALELARAGATIGNGSNAWVEPVFEAIADISKRAAALAVVDETSSVSRIDPRVEIALRTLLDDIDGAMRVADVAAQPGTVFEMDVLFLPELRPLRQHPDFPQLMEKLGVQSYWDEHGCVWQNDSVSCTD